MLLLTLFSALCLAELVIHRKDGAALQEFDYDSVIAIYYRLQKVQWPTVIAFLEAPDEDVQTYLGCLKAQRENCSFEVAKQMDLGVYDVKWVPDTVFQLATMISVAKTNSFQDEKGTVSYVVLPEELKQVSFNDAIDKAADAKPDQMMSIFLKASIEFGHHFDKVYLNALRYYAHFNGDNWESQVDLMFADYIKLIGWTPATGEEKKYFYLTSCPINEWLDPFFDETIKAYVKEEVKAAKLNHFLLSRGTSGMDAVLRQGDEETILPVFDIPTFDFSVSYGSRLLDGSMMDIEPKLGARSLGYFYDTKERKSKLGYLLELPIVSYLDGFSTRFDGAVSLYNLFYIPPLSSMSGLFGRLEAFHPRTKLGFTDGFGGYNIMGRPQLLEIERKYEVGIFRSLSRSKDEWLKYFLQVLSQAISLQTGDGEISREFKRRQAGQQKLASSVGEPQYTIERVKETALVVKQTPPWTQSDIPPVFSEVKYNTDNTFRLLISRRKQFTTPIYESNQYAIAFGDHIPRVHTHILVIPSLFPQARYVQFLNLINEADDEEIEGFFRTIHRAAENARWTRALHPYPKEVNHAPRDLVRHGYRVVMNSFGKKEYPNIANQVVPHLHAHIGGGECLKEVHRRDRSKILDVKIEKLLSEIREEVYGVIIKVYESPMTRTQPSELIFEMTDMKGKHLYDSIHHFAGSAPAYLIRRLGRRIIQQADQKGFINTGFRIYSNHGLDAHHGMESHFRLHVAYGDHLSPTLEECQGRQADYHEIADQEHPHFIAEEKSANSGPKRAREGSEEEPAAKLPKLDQTTSAQSSAQSPKEPRKD